MTIVPISNPLQIFAVNFMLSLQYLFKLLVQDDVSPLGKAKLLVSRQITSLTFDF